MTVRRRLRKQEFLCSLWLKFHLQQLNKQQYLLLHVYQNAYQYIYTKCNWGQMPLMMSNEFGIITVWNEKTTSQPKNPQQTNNTWALPPKKETPNKHTKKKREVTKKGSNCCLNYRFISNKSFFSIDNITARQLLFYWLQIIYQKMLWCFCCVPWCTRIRWSVDKQNWPSHFSCAQTTASCHRHH